MSEQDRLLFWTKTLNLPEFRVVHERRDQPDDPIRFTLVPVQGVALCPQCGHGCSTIHRHHEYKPIKDLPLGERPVELLLHAPQFSCECCGCYFTPTYSAIAPGTHATRRFLAQAARMIRFSDVANVADFFGVPENTLGRWYYDFVEGLGQAPPANLKPITCIGIDELSLKKSTASSSP